MARLIAIRHAPTEADGLCVGRFEVPVRVDHATAAATMLSAAREALDVPPTVVWSSPLTRCAEPAACLARDLGVERRLDPRLLELSYGAWEGRPWAMLECEDGARLSAWMETWRESAPPEGESVAQLDARVRAWWRALDDDTHLLVAHAGVVRALRVVVAGWSWEDAMGTPVPHLRAECFDRVSVS